MEIQRKNTKRLLNSASGFLQGYTHTLNPYAGCSFACSYCYVRQMPVGLFRGDPWGSWVDVKEGAGDLLRKELTKAKIKGKVTIFMSSSTDPYQPIEVKEGITRSLLEVMTEMKPDFLFVQTRSPLIVRDLDLLTMLKDRIRISMTVETDREDIRRSFTPSAPPIQARLRAIRQIAEMGIPVQAALAPILPCSEQFGALLAGIVDRVCLDTTFMGDGSLGKRTERLKIDVIYRQLGLEDWYRPDAYMNVYRQLSTYFPMDKILISQAGFLPD